MGVAAARAKGHGYHLRTPVTEEVSAYYAATSPMAMQEARQQSAQQPEQAHQPEQRPADPFSSAYQRPATRSNDAPRQPVVREYLDLPTDTNEIPQATTQNPITQGQTTMSVDPFVRSDQGQGVPAAENPFEDAVPSTEQTNRYAGEFPPELLPRQN